GVDDQLDAVTSVSGRSRCSKRFENCFIFIFYLALKRAGGSSLSFQCIYYIHCSNCLTFGMFGVSDSISDNVLQENFEHTTSFFVDKARQSFDTTSSG
ncbi:solute carrier family 26, partial [Brachionus plicatilis]